VIAIPVVFTLLFTYLFGGALAGSPGRYLQYILPGTLVMAVLLVTMYAGVGLNTDKTKGAQAGRTGRYLLDDLKHYVEHGAPSPRKQRQLDRAAARGRPLSSWPWIRPGRAR
jgi:hypothetical protein